MQSVMSNVELVAKIVGWLDDIPSIVRSSGVSRSFRKATMQAAHTHLVISASDKSDRLDPRSPRQPTLSEVVKWMQRKDKLLSELRSVHIPAREEFKQCDHLSFGMILQMLYDSRPTQLKTAADLLFSSFYNMPSVRDVTICCGKWRASEAYLHFSSISDSFPKLERLVLSHDVALCIDDTSSSMKQLQYLQFGRFAIYLPEEEGDVNDFNSQLPALQEVQYCIHTNVDDDEVEDVNKLLQVRTLRRAGFSVHPLVTKQIVFQVSPDLEVSVKRYGGAPQIGFHSPLKWH